MSAQQFMEMLFGRLPEFFKDEDALRALWSTPDTRKKRVFSAFESASDASRFNIVLIRPVSQLPIRFSPIYNGPV